MSCSVRSKSSLFSKPVRSSSALAIALAFCGVSQQLRAQEDAAGKQLIVVVDGTAEGDDEVAEEAAPKFWLGILLKEIEGDLATYLGTDQGVLVDSVFPDSPAETAGLKKGDILLMVGDDELHGPADLLEAMQSLKMEDEKPIAMALTVLRKGKEVKVDLTPAPRPTEADDDKKLPKVIEFRLDEDMDDAEVDGAKAYTFSFSGDLPSEEMKSLLEQIKIGTIDRSVDVLRLGNPSMVWGTGTVDAENLDVKQEGEVTVVIRKDVDGKKFEVTVNRTDEEPAKITVKSGDETQAFTEDELKDMSQETRWLVEPILKNKVLRLRVNDGGQVHLDAIQAALSGNEVKQVSEKLLKAVTEMQLKARLSSVDALKAKALQSALEVREIAEKSAARVQLKAQTQGNVEVDSLKKMIEELRSEVEQLRKQLDKSE